jgi:hypothetical protein
MGMVTPETSLEPLELLVGEWRLEASWEDQPPAEGDASVTFEWMPGRQFLVQRWTVDVPEAPDGLAVIGADPAAEGGYLQHYFDSRGVARVYKMTLADGIWRLWRDEADFSPLDFRQRYTGTFSDDGRTITGAWEICHDSTTWEHDFALSYLKRP